MLELRDVSYAYGESAAVGGVTVSFAERQLVALTGPNGSGKSTLLKLLGRVHAPQLGTIAFDGRPLSSWNAKEYARQVGYLPQEPDPAFPMRALDVVLSGRAPYLDRFEWEKASDFDRAREALASCDAAHLAERYFDEMSGGERKRVFLARVLVGSPRLILLDEPLSALDLAHVQQLSRLLRDIVDRTGATIVFAVHDLNWAALHSDRMLIMQRGTLALDAPPAEAMRPENLRAYFGFEAATVVRDGRAWIVPA
jgi:iron complex transport system ATP-binding protein